MKKQFKIMAGGLLSLFVLFASCDKDAEILSSFPFALSENHIGTTPVNYPQKTVFKIDPERKVSTNVYMFSYEVLSGSGAYIDAKGNPVPEGEYIELPGLSPEFTYVSSTIGKEKVRVHVKDRGTEDAVLDVEYEIGHNPYTVQFSSPTAVAKVNQPKGTSLSLFNTGPDKSVTYERAFFFLQGKGGISTPGTGDIVPLETFVPNGEGSTNYDLIFSEIGEAKVMVSTRDSNRQIKNDTLVFQVEGIDVSFSSTADKNNTFLGQEFNINFELTEEQGAGGKYKMLYQVNEGTATVMSDGRTLEPGILYDVVTGGFTWKVMGRQEGPLKLSFIVKDGTGGESKREVSLSVLKAGINFNAVPVAPQALVGQSVAFNASIDETPSPAPPYSLKFESSGTGSLSYKGTEYGPGEAIAVDAAEFSFTYTGKVPGDHDITFSVTNGNGAQGGDVRSLFYNNANFNFSAAPEGSSVVLGATKKVIFDFDQLGSDQNFSMKYGVVSGDFTMKGSGEQRNPGQYYDMANGTSQWEITPVSQGDISIVFTARNGLGVEKVAEVSLSVDLPTLVFDAVPVASEALVGQSVAFNASIGETPSPAPPYSLKFESSSAGKLTYKGTEYVPGEAITVDAAEFSFTYTGESLGEHAISFTMTNAAGAHGTKTKTITLTDDAFAFSGAPQDNSIYRTENTNLNFNISQPSGTGPYQMKYVITKGAGTIRDQQGNIVGSNTLISVPTGNFVWNLTGTTVGETKVDFVAVSPTGLEKKVVVSVNVLQTTFTFDAVRAASSGIVNNAVGVNFGLVKQGAEPISYSMKFSSNRTGKFTYNGTVYSAGQTIPLGTDPDNFQGSYKGEEAGQHSVSFTVTSSISVVKSDTESIMFNANEFTFNVTGSTNSGVINSPKTISFNVQENFSGVDTYTAIYENSEEGIFIYKGQTIEPGHPFSLNPGNSSAVYTPTNAGTHHLSFSVTSTSGQVEEDDVTMNIQTNVFNFTSTPQKPTELVNESIPIAFNLAESISGIDTYSATFSTDGTGMLSRNGETINNGHSFVLMPGNSNVVYTGFSPGTHHISFTVKSSSGQTIVKGHNLTFMQTGFDLELSSNTDFYELGSGQAPPTITLGITPVGASSSFTYSYSASPSGTLIDGTNPIEQNVEHSVPSGSKNFGFFNIASGTKVITVTVRDEYGNVDTKSVSINFFTGLPAPSASQRFMLSNVQDCQSNGSCPGSLVGRNGNPVTYSMVLSFSASGVNNANIDFFEVATVPNSDLVTVTVDNMRQSLTFNRSYQCISLYEDETVSNLVVLNNETSFIDGLTCEGQSPNDPYDLYKSRVPSNRTWTLKGSQYRVRAVLLNGSRTDWATVTVPNIIPKAFSSPWAF